jgi:hypothetical protein
MILHHNTLISLDIIQKNFFCHLEKCKGACCVEGDFGAPLEIEEIADIEEYLPIIREYMTDTARELLDKDGFYETDPFDIYVTKCINKADCIFCYKEDRTARCAIEKVHSENKISFRKPISCHLYPIRISQMESYEALNYHQWSVCEPARILGDELGIPLYKFLKEALIRKYGKDWYTELEEIVEEFNKEGVGF